jgi:resorcinol 4-hydroxylase (NADPH)
MVVDGAPDRSTEVVVIGAGPVGLVTSLLLAGRGHSVLLVERWPTPYPLPRAIGLSHESLRILHMAGVGDTLEPAMEWDERYLRGVFVTAAGEVLMEMPFRAQAESGWPEMRGFHQPRMEELLTELLAVHDHVTVKRGYVATQVDQDELGVTVLIAQSDADGEPRVGAPVELWRGKYLVGCDGANSMVRASLGIDMLGELDFSSDWLVVDIEPTVSRDWVPFLGQIFGPPRPVTCAPAGPGRRRFEFMLLPGESRPELEDDEVVWRLLAEQGVNPDNARLVRHASYTFLARWAQRWRDGRMLLAGDSAHLTPPFLSQGLNSGLRDAATLVWRLDLVLRGVVEADTLDDYGSERCSHVSRQILQAIELGKMICLVDPDATEQRDAVLRQVRDSRVPPPSLSAGWLIGAGAIAESDPHAGTLGRQGPVQVADDVGLFDDICGSGAWVLLSRRADALHQLSPKARSIWKRLGGRAFQVGADGSVVDLEGVYGDWFDETKSEVLVIRPDFYVFGAGASLQDANRLVLQVAETLHLDQERIPEKVGESA